jgi:hypothetical protein
MGLYFRKSLGSGPLRLNLSKGGVGFSSGVKGARIGVDARGRAYVHCGRGGVYYRSFLGGSGRPALDPTPPLTTPRTENTTGGHRAIESGEVAAMVPATAIGLLAELQRRNDLFPWHILYAAVLTVATIAAFALDIPPLGIALAPAAIAGTVLLARWNNRRRTLRIDYHLDDEYGERYSAVLTAFEQLRRAQCIWLVESEAAVYNRKYHAGAGSTITRTRVAPVRALPPGVKSNIIPPMIPAGRQRLYLLPDRILVYERKQVGAVEYSELQLDATTTQFIEGGHPPTDAPQVDTTWKYVNKSGGPDRRFNDNRQLPVLRYGELRWRSASGLNELHQVSNPESAARFAQVVSNLAAGLPQA